VSFGAIVLAAGSSDRMGSPKPLLHIQGTTFLEHILDHLDHVPELDSVVVVLGAKAALIRESVELGRAVPVNHRGHKLGMFSSVRAGIRALVRKQPDLEGAMVVLVDMPLVRGETYGTLLYAYQAMHDDAVLAAYQGEAGHPILLSRNLTLRLADTGLAEPAEETLAEFLEAHAERRRYVDAHDPGVLVNINTPQAYKTHLGPEAGANGGDGEGAGEGP
jgi:molybdenum cofactor cytidylyltransferase